MPADASSPRVRKRSAPVSTHMEIALDATPDHGVIAGSTSAINAGRSAFDSVKAADHCARIERCH